MPEKTPTRPESTPMMRQYQAIKAQVPGALLLFRLGDFYELFYDDAVTAARDLDITLTSRQNSVPMCGVPYHAAETYIARLLGKGHKVAICDQTELPKKGVKLVPREISRVVTPGTVTDMSVLRAGENNYLMGLIEEDGCLGAAFLDLSTGEFRAFESRDDDRWDRLRLDLDHLRPREAVFPEGSRFPLPADRIEGCVLTPRDPWIFEADTAARLLATQFGTTGLDGFGAGDRKLAIGAAGALVHYARETQRSGLEHISGIRFESHSPYMVLDRTSIRNLELLESAGGDRRDSMLGVIDRSKTGMGARLTRWWLLRPSMDPSEILARQAAVAELVVSSSALGTLTAPLEGMGDIERLLSKITVGTATPRDVAAFGAALGRLPALRESIEGMDADRFRDLAGDLDPIADIHELIRSAIREDPPANLNDGGVIKDGFDPELDQLRGLSGNGKAFLTDIEKRERKRTGIQSMKVRFNRVFGYYLEVSKTNLHLVPDDYIRRQTLANAERYVTEELKEYEEKILTAEERIVAIERRLFAEVGRGIARAAARIRRTARIVGELDVIAGLGAVARRAGWTRPELSRDGSLLIRQGRHPVLEALAEDHRSDRFIPNDLFMNDQESRIHIITGPNMGGKSTYLRQTALIVILAQMGSFVPADLLRFPVVDRIFTRIGASDNIARGQSTFMVEMTEAAVILNTATPKSLIVLDEIGRGTATFDGLSIAWAMIEHIQSAIGAKTLFATHYHELTELAELLEGVRNFNLRVREADDRIVFLRRVEEGAADRSYGIEVARLAGVPRDVVARAREILKKHEETGQELSDNLTLRARRKTHTAVHQLGLFSPQEDKVRARLGEVDINRTSPLEALRILSELKDITRES
jgi:DNA mismatch repair protein MutS